MSTPVLIDGDTAELLDPDAIREDCAATVREASRRGVAVAHEAVDIAIEQGRALLVARRTFPSDREYGAWFAAQSFGFSLNWGRTLKAAAENEAEFRAAVVSQLTTGTKPNIDKAVRSLSAPASGDGDDAPASPSPSPALPKKELHGIRRNVELAAKKGETEYRLSIALLLRLLDALEAHP